VSPEGRPSSPSPFSGHLINDRVTLINGRVMLINGRVQVVNGRVTLINGRVTLINGRVTPINGRVTPINGRVTLINGRVRLINGRVMLIYGRVMLTNGRVKPINGRVKPINGVRALLGRPATAARSWRRLLRRQDAGDGRPLADAAADRQPPPVRADDLVAERQAHARAVGLGAGERQDCAPQRRLRHPRAAVAHREQELPGRRSGDLRVTPSPARACRFRPGERPAVDFKCE
jgi:hypothetical protein